MNDILEKTKNLSRRSRNECPDSKQQRLVGIDSALIGTKVEFMLRASESRGHGVNLSQEPNAVGNVEFHSTGPLRTRRASLAHGRATLRDAPYMTRAATSPATMSRPYRRGFDADIRVGPMSGRGDELRPSRAPPSCGEAVPVTSSFESLRPAALALMLGRRAELPACR